MDLQHVRQVSGTVLVEWRQESRPRPQLPSVPPTPGLSHNRASEPDLESLKICQLQNRTIASWPNKSKAKTVYKAIKE